jgi:hypothetical protein
MSLTYNGTELQGITYNGADVQTVTYNGVEVWSAHPPFLVRMRYDANEATHVKDLVGGYTITTQNASGGSGGAIPAATDPFGGNNALNLNNVVISYSGAKEIDGLTSTIACWVKLPDRATQQALICGPNGNNDGRDNRAIFFTDNKVAIATGLGDFVTISPSVSDSNWHFYEINTDNTTVRCFIDGVLKGTISDSSLSTYRYWKRANNKMWIGAWAWREGTSFLQNASIYDFCILNGVWHTENYNVPTAYI